MSQKDGGLAFPSEHSDGMTLLDYFAAKAMQGMLANSLGTTHVQPVSTAPVEAIAEWSYLQAKAMLAERLK